MVSLMDARVLLQFVFRAVRNALRVSNCVGLIGANSANIPHVVAYRFFPAAPASFG
jgi:hypothetical protein